MIIAEEITARFLNVISLFNGHIPLIALQLGAYRVGESVGLLFTKVVDELALGLVDEDEEIAEVSDRAYWVERGTQMTVAMADRLVAWIDESVAKGFSLKYNKFYIGLERQGQPNNFVVFRPRKNQILLEIRLPKTEEIDQLLEGSDLDVMDYDTKWHRYRLRLVKNDLEQHKALIIDLMRRAGDQAGV